MDKEELKIPAEEGIPSQVKDQYTDRYTSRVYDYDKHEYKKDEQGNDLYELDKKGLKEAIKNWAKAFTFHGITVEDIDFDEYRIEGYSIDSAPNKCITVVKYEGNFYVRDKRTNSDSKTWIVTGSGRIYRDRDHKLVSVEKIPDSQLLGKAKEIWVIPEEVLVTNVRELKNERQRSRSNTGKFRRYRNGEDPLQSKWYLKGTGSYVDKSGFLVDKKDLAERLAEFKKNKISDDTPSGLVEEYTKAMLTLVDKINSMIRRGMTALNFLVENSNNLPREGYELVRLIRDVKSDIADYLSKPEKFAKKFEETTSQEETESFKRRLKDLIVTIDEYFVDNYRGQQLKEQVEFLEKAVEEEKLKTSGATESIKGHKPNKVLQATEGHFVPKSIMAAFEEV